MTTQQPPPAQLNQAIVKQVLSGDTVVLRKLTSKVLPSKERTLSLSSVSAPKLARRPNQSGENATKDEPYAWEAREFLRKKVIGKVVLFTVDTTTQDSKREYGTIFLFTGKDSPPENVTETMVSEGLVDVRRTNIKSTESHQRLCNLEDIAKQSGKGKFGPNASEHVRTITWSVENPRNFVDSLHQKPVKAVIEHVRDGSTLRALLLPSSGLSEFYSITLMISGIRCPTFRDEIPERYAEEARYYTECKLLHRDVEIILESISNQNFLGTVLHPNGNIAEHLLLEGLAKCVDWSLQCVTTGLEKLRAAEKLAKEKRLRLWEGYVPSGATIDPKDKEFTGKVLEVVNGDAIVLRLADGSNRKVFLSSIRPPRLPENSPDIGKPKLRLLYDVPYMYEAREFLRKKLIGKKVNCTLDYKQPASKTFPEKECCTVTIGGMNVAEALVSKGLATVVRYRADDDQRSAHYDELLSAETKAIKACKGMHNKKEVPVHRIVDLSVDLLKAKQFLPFLQRAGRMEAVVEHIIHGARLKLIVPRENCIITLLLAGISCVRSARIIGNGVMQDAEPYGDAAVTYTKEMCMQREVEIEVENIDRAGNYIGWLWVDNINWSEHLVREGYAKVHSTAARSPYYRQLQIAQEEAQKKKLRVWENDVPEELETQKVEEEKSERNVDYVKVMVTEVKLDLTFYAQLVKEGPKLDELMQKLRQDLTTNPPLVGAYTPKKGDVCAARFQDDGLWYRAKIDKIQGSHITVNYIDYGNKENTVVTNLASLPSTYQALPPFAHEYSLAFIKCPKDAEAALDARAEFFEKVNNRVISLNVEYKVGNIAFVHLLTEEREDIGRDLIAKGFVLVDAKKEKRFQKIVTDYLSAQESAKKERLNLWQYGDVTEDDAKEFG